jgi:membrane protein DedA with SNARE-associated domain
MIHQLLHSLILFWFELLKNWGYGGVFILMAMESSIIPVPSEIVMPPAAFWAAQGKMNIWGVILAGTLGSYVGSAISYWVAQWIGLPLIQRYGKRFMISEEKMFFAQKVIEKYGAMGIFISRLLPVVRHLISIPAGILKMPFLKFSIVTTVGAGIWCAILSWAGQELIGAHPELLDSPEALSAVIKTKLLGFVLAVGVFGALYAAVVWMKRRSALAALLLFTTISTTSYKEAKASSIENPLFAFSHLAPSPFTMRGGRVVLGTHAAIGVTDFLQFGTNVIHDFYRVYNVNAKASILDFKEFAMAFTLGYQTYNLVDISLSNPSSTITAWMPGLVGAVAIGPQVAVFVAPNLNFSQVNVNSTGIATSGFVHGASIETDISWAYNPHKKSVGNVFSAGASYDFTYQMYGVGLSHHWPGFHVGVHYYPNASGYNVLPIIAGGAVVDL